jgi:hypothetical protein
LKKLFISMPMERGLQDSDIFKAKAEAESIVGENVEIMDLYDQVVQGENPLERLSISIGLLAKADIAYFGGGWKQSTKCVIENLCAVKYGIITIESN